MTRVLFMSEEEARTTLYCAGLNEDYEFYVVGNIERNQTIQFHPMCKKFINLEHKLSLDEDSKAIADELIDIIRKESIDVLLPVSIVCMAIVDKYKEELGKHVKITPFPTKESIDLLDNKYNFYQFCKDNDIAHPESVLADTYNDIDPAKTGIDFPFLIKPILGAGGFHTLVFIKNREDLDEFLARPEEKKTGYFPALVQEFFEGEDIDFNGFSVNGKVLASSVMRTTFYDKDPDLYFTEFVRNDDVLKLGNKILEVSGYSGPTNIDMRIRESDGKLMLIELNPRYWARVHVSLMDKMNFLDIGIKAALGKDIHVESTCPKKVWVSAMSPLVKAVIKNRDISYLKYFLTLSAEEIRFLLYYRKFIKDANKKLAMQTAT